MHWMIQIQNQVSSTLTQYASLGWIQKDQQSLCLCCTPSIVSTCMKGARCYCQTINAMLPKLGFLSCSSGNAYLDEIMAVSLSRVIFVIPRFEFLVSFVGQSSASALCQEKCTGSMQTGSSTTNSTWTSRRSILDHQIVPTDMGDLVNCKQLFKGLSQPNVFASTALLGYYSSIGTVKDCIETYCKMRASGVPSDSYVFPKVLKSCAQFQSLEAGSAVHKDVFVYGSNYNQQVGNSLIDMYAKCLDIESAGRVFNEMEERDLLSWNSFISGCVSNNLLREAVELLPHMRLDVVKPDIVTLNTVMDAYCRMGCCVGVQIIMKQIAEPNIISWTTLVSGYLRIGEHKAALDVFRNMTHDVKVHPDICSLSNILTACHHMGHSLIR